MSESEIEAVARLIAGYVCDGCFDEDDHLDYVQSARTIYRNQAREVIDALDRVRGPQGEAQGGDAITGESGPAKARRVWEGSERGEHEAKSALLKATSEVPRLVRELDKARAEVEHLRSELAPSPKGEDHEALEAKVREVMASPSYATATDEQRARWIVNHLAAQRMQGEDHEAEQTHPGREKKADG